MTGRFEFKANENSGAGCPGGTLADMEVSKRELENQVRQRNGKVVEVDWTYAPNPVEIARHTTPHEMNVPPGPNPTHTFCLSDLYQGVFYSTGPFDAGGNLTWGKWYSGFNRMLTEKYSFKGNAKCYVATLDDARRLMNQRSEGARASGRKIVDTGWKYDPNTVAVAKPSVRDDDPEPVQNPAPTSPTKQSRDAAMKELPESKAYCAKDPMLSVVFNCDWFARNVYNYRTEHPTDTLPVSTLVAESKVDLSSAIDNTHVSLWISNRANAQGLENKVTNCITQNVIVTLQKTPVASQLPTFYKSAAATCSKAP